MNARKKKRLSRGALIVLLLALLILLGLGFGWARCGLGRGDGDGDDKGKANSELQRAVSDPSASPPADARPAICTLRVDSDGSIRHGGETVAAAAAAGKCQGASEVALDVAGDAPYGAVEDLRKALEAAGLNVRD